MTPADGGQQPPGSCLEPDFEFALRPVFTLRSRDWLPIRITRRALAAAATGESPG